MGIMHTELTAAATPQEAGTKVAASTRLRC
jgi:hypothetical protein